MQNPSSSQSFLRQLATQLIARYGGQLDQLHIIFPTRRAVVFFKEALSQQRQETFWAPEIISIQDFVRQASGWHFPENLVLISELYQTYLTAMKTLQPDWFEPFDRFYAWGEMLIKDFDEIDKYCVEAEQLFTNIRDLREIELRFALPPENLEALARFWGTLQVGENEDEDSEIKQRFLRIWGQLFTIYQSFKERLQAQHKAYDGMAYRELAQRENFGEGQGKYIFAGFNVLSVAEERFIGNLLQKGSADIFWDVDSLYFPVDQDTPRAQLLLEGEPGKFIYYYHQKWKEQGSYLIAHEFAAHPIQINVSGASLNYGQSQALGRALHAEGITSENLRDYAVVLADESLLFPVLYALPSEINKLNITMGFPLRQTYIFHLLTSLVSMIRSARREDAQWLYTYQDVINLLRNPYLQGEYPELTQHIIREIQRKNWVFVSRKQLEAFELQGLLAHMFAVPHEVDAVFNYFAEIFEITLAHAQEREAALEAEYIYHFYTQFNQLRMILEQVSPSLSITGFATLFRELMQGIRIPFEGEPLEGLQVLGFLETRVLDFKKIFILSANEGKLPVTSSGNSFIPYQLRKGFGLPTYEEKENIFSYHFYRLIQRAEEVHLFYNAVVKDGGGVGEQSRFLRQIEHFLRYHPNVSYQNQQENVPVPYSPRVEITIPTTDEIQEQLKGRYTGEQGTGYLSATAMTTFLGCPLRYYFRYVAGIKEPDKVEENMEANTFGSILHLTMEYLYQPYVGKLITAEIIKELKARLDESLDRAFTDQGLEAGENLSGKNYLLYGVIRQLCMRVLEQDEAGESFQIMSLEEGKFFLHRLKLEEQVVQLNGLFDRVDFLPRRGVYRIIDYKTGKAQIKSNVTIDECFDKIENKEEFQGFLYAYLYQQKYPEHAVIMGFYRVRQLSQGIQYLNGGYPIKAEMLSEFERRLKLLLSRIWKEGFPQTDEESRCAYCPYKQICNRG